MLGFFFYWKTFWKALHPGSEWPSGAQGEFQPDKLIGMQLQASVKNPKKNQNLKKHIEAVWQKKEVELRGRTLEA